MDSPCNSISLSNAAPVLNFIFHFKTIFMQRELIINSNLLDILFENRNKAYGAYQLRKYYGNRLFKALAMMMGIVILLTAYTLLPGKQGFITRDWVINDPGTAKLKAPDKKLLKPKEAIKQPRANTRKFMSNVVIVPNDHKADSMIDLSPNTLIGSVNTNSKFKIDEPPLVSAPDNGVQTVAGAVKKTADRNIPVYTADVMPAFPGGMEALRRFLQKYLQNPKDLEEGEQVNVEVNFVVGYDGKLKSFVVVQDGGDEFNREVIRVLKKMPEWIPGKANGENVSVYYNIPVKFIPAE